MVIRIVGIIGGLLGLLWLLSGIQGVFHLSDLPDTAYANGVKFGIMAKIPLGLALAFYGFKWAICGYGKKKDVTPTSA